MPNFQDRSQSEIVINSTDHISLERLSSDDAKRLKSFLTESNLQVHDSNLESTSVDPNTAASKHIEIDCFINADPSNRQLILENLVRARSLMGRNRRSGNESLMIRFFKFLVINLPQRNMVFNIKKGRMIYKRNSQNLRRTNKLFISVKDPFIKTENLGINLTDENKFNLLILKLKEFIFETSKGRIEDFITNTMCPPEDEAEDD